MIRSSITLHICMWFFLSFSAWAPDAEAQSRITFRLFVGGRDGHRRLDG